MTTLIDCVGAFPAMNQNVTASFGLSLLTLLFFAVLLYQPDPPRRNSAIKPAAVEPKSSNIETAKSTCDAPSKAKAEARAEPSARPALESEPDVSAKKATAETPPAVVDPAAAPPEKQQASPSATAPRPAMTRVAEGETFDEFVKRVYGPDGDPIAVWKSNRDILSGPDAPLTPGTMLRTP